MHYSNIKTSDVYYTLLKVQVAMTAWIMRLRFNQQVYQIDWVAEYPSTTGCVALKKGFRPNDLRESPEYLLVLDGDKFNLFKYLSSKGSYCKVHFLCANNRKVQRSLGKLYHRTRKLVNLSSGVCEDLHGNLHISK